MSKEIKVIIYNNDDVTRFDTIAHMHEDTIRFAIYNDEGSIDVVLDKGIDMVTMTMSAKFSASYCFKENQITEVQYITPHGEMSIPLKCNQIHWTNEKIYIDYEIDIGNEKPLINSFTLLM